MLEKPTEDDKQVLRDLKQVFDELDLPILLVGAGARLMIFDRPNNLQARATKDWDIATPMMQWSEYELLRDRLSRQFSLTSIYHRFIHHETQMTVDIIPFGEISDRDREIHWQTDDTVMTVAGYEEAFATAKTLQIDDIDLKVINIPAFVGLKLLAWGDRGDKTRKDLDDIDWILTHYQDDERVYEELYEVLANETLNYQDAAIYLLGQDIYDTFALSTLARIQVILTQVFQKLNRDRDSTFGAKLNVLQRGLERR
jgi:predicted nucleotidyltransferase